MRLITFCTRSRTGGTDVGKVCDAEAMKTSNLIGQPIPPAVAL
jgi:hypothetical protein